MLTDTPPRTGAYSAYKRALAGRPLPVACVDLEAFDANARALAMRAGAKTLRVATKSVRSVALLRRALAADARYQGLMCFHPDEAVYLAEAGFDDLLMGYPAIHPTHLAAMARVVASGKRLVAMVDSAEHALRLEAAGAAAGCVMPVCLDVDMSLRLPGLHFGVRRSGITTAKQAVAVAEAIDKLPHVKLVGVMGYEAQIAGVPDAVPGDWLKNTAVTALKAMSIREVASRRASVVAALQRAGAQLELVNGGGTGSLESTAAEACVSEVTVGSGLYAPTLFDGYQAFKHRPAAFYALEVTRRPEPGVYTCAGGGYVASGACEPAKLPKPFLPAGARLLELEGAGEVQTPIAYSGPEPLALGDPIFMRHAKAGELCERFDALLLIEQGAVVDTVTTYRGDGRCFL